jgi:hypothetical protein
VASYPRAISLGIVLLDSIVDQLPRRADRAVSVAYKHHAYDVVNDQLDDITLRLSRELEREGYRAYPIPSTQRVNDEKICAAFSHKIAAPPHPLPGRPGMDREELPSGHS